jgi:hypothetical protein
MRRPSPGNSADRQVMCRAAIRFTTNFFDDRAPGQSPTGMNSRSPDEEAPNVTTTTLRLYLFPRGATTPDPEGTTPPPELTPVAAAPAAPAPGAEDAPFSEEILDWMSRGDSLAAEPRVVAEVVDLGLDEPRIGPPPGMRSRRAAVRERQLRRVLTVGALGFAVWAVVLWTTRHSVSVGDRSALAATSETASALSPSPAARSLRPINPNAPGAAFATAAASPPASAPVAAAPAAAEKSAATEPTAHAPGRQRSAATPSKRHRRARR